MIESLEEPLQELASYIQKQCGLSIYRLTNHFLTHDPIEGYVFLTEWMPKRVVPHNDQKHPDGTAIVSINYNTKDLLSVVFLNDVSFADYKVLPHTDGDSFINWLEANSSLTYGEQFVLAEDKGKTIIYKPKIGDYEVLPHSQIKIRFNDDGQLIYYIREGKFPKMGAIQANDYALEKNQTDEYAKDALRLYEVPVESTESWKPFYMIQESLVTNDGRVTFDQENINERSVFYEVNHRLTWSNAVSGRFIKEDIELHEQASVHDAENEVPHKDHVDLTEDELIQVVQESARVIQLHFPDEPGEWSVKQIFRQHGLILSVVERTNERKLYGQKLKIFFNDELHAIHLIDNNVIYELLQHYQDSPEPEISREAAFEKLAPHVELTPIYAYDRKTKTYQVHGKLHCPIAIDAISGEVVNIDELIH